jgi:hypothetical protein
LNNSKAEEILESENIAANILAQAIEILAHIFKQGTGTKFFSLFSFLFVFIQTCQMNCEAPSQILTISLVIAWKQLPFILHYPEFTKKRELCFAISADTLVSYRTFHYDTELPKKEAHTVIQYQTRRPNQHRHSQSPDICKRYALFWQQMT